MNKEQLHTELDFKAIRSSGPGGQNVNKVASKVVLSWNPGSSLVFSEEEKDIIYLKLKNRINKEGVLSLECDTSRSQIKNKEIVRNRFFELLAQALKKEKPRQQTKIPKGALRRRKEAKEQVSLKKALRKRLDY